MVSRQSVLLTASVVATLVILIALLWALSERFLFIALALFFLGFNFVYLLMFFRFEKSFSKDPVATSFPPVSILIPAYNESRSIGKTIESVLGMGYRGKLEIVVIDDGSSDNTAQVAKQYPDVRVCRKNNGGKASALNFGLQKARFDLVATLDADSFPQKDALNYLVGYFEDPHVSGVSSSVLVHEPKSLLEKVQVFEYLSINFMRKVNEFFNAQYVTPGPLSLFRKQSLLSVGGFDETALTEDIDMSINLLKHHLVVKHSMQSRVYTLVPNTLNALFRQRVRWARGGIICTRKYLDLFLNKSHGYFGLFIFPINFVIFIVFLMYFVFKLLVVVANQLLNLAGALFGIWHIRDLDWTFFFGKTFDITLWANFQSILFVFSFFAFLWYLSKVLSVSEFEFRPRFLAGFALLVFYWSIFIWVVYIYSLLLELTQRDRTW